MDIVTFTLTVLGLVIGYALGAVIGYFIDYAIWKHKNRKNIEKSKNAKNAMLNYNEEQNNSL